MWRGDVCERVCGRGESLGWGWDDGDVVCGRVGGIDTLASGFGSDARGVLGDIDGLVGAIVIVFFFGCRR